MQWRPSACQKHFRVSSGANTRGRQIHSGQDNNSDYRKDTFCFFHEIPPGFLLDFSIISSAGKSNITFFPKKFIICLLFLESDSCIIYRHMVKK